MQKIHIRIMRYNFSNLINNRYELTKMTTEMNEMLKPNR
jgi:hypothetical protein